MKPYTKAYCFLTVFLPGSEQAEPQNKRITGVKSIIVFVNQHSHKLFFESFIAEKNIKIKQEEVKNTMQTGKYILHKNSFLAGNKKLVIKKRVKPSTKPELYLIQLEPFKYVSSLFPVPTTSGEEFTFDYEKRLYALRKLANQVEVLELEP